MASIPQAHQRDDRHQARKVSALMTLINSYRRFKSRTSTTLKVLTLEVLTLEVLTLKVLTLEILTLEAVTHGILTIEVLAL